MFKIDDLKKTVKDLGNKLLVARVKDRGKAWLGSLGWTGTHCYI